MARATAVSVEAIFKWMCFIVKPEYAGGAQAGRVLVTLCEPPQSKNEDSALSARSRPYSLPAGVICDGAFWKQVARESSREEAA